MDPNQQSQPFQPEILIPPKTERLASVGYHFGGKLKLVILAAIVLIIFVWGGAYYLGVSRKAFLSQNNKTAVNVTQSKIQEPTLIGTPAGKSISSIPVQISYPTPTLIQASVNVPTITQKPIVTLVPSFIPVPTLIPINTSGNLSGNFCVFDFRNNLNQASIANLYFNYCEENMPKIAAKLSVGMNGRRVNLRYDGTISAYAHVDGDSLVFQNWIPNTGFLLHEGVHFVQNYGNKASGREWVMEGLADMVRYKLTKTSDEPGWAIGCRSGEGYSFGYGCAAAFFIWMEGYCGKSDVQINLNRMILDGTDTNSTFNNLCGKNVDDLWNIYKSTNPSERIYPSS